MAAAQRLSCPPGFDFPGTVAVLRRGPLDPLHWSDGRRWRRLLAVGGHTVLVEASWGRTLTVRRLAGAAPPDLVRRAVTRVLGLDDPGPALARLLPAPSRHLARRHGGVLLPGYATLFEGLVQTVLGQQIHAKGANRHRAAFVYAFGARYDHRRRAYWAFPTPGRLAGVRVRQIRALGISTTKARAILAIARTVRADALSEERLAAMPAEEAIAVMSALPGVGRWTGEWVLLRALRRFEIVPAGDLAVRKAVAWALGRRALLSERQVRAAVRRWAPYGGLVAFRVLNAHRQAVG